MNILCIIPARSGSKSINDKNIQSFFGKPLLAHSIEHSLSSKLITRTILSTDSEYYANFGKSFGAEIPFLRPTEFSLDLSTDLDVFLHALNHLKLTENYVPDLVVHLRPTTPIRNVDEIDQMIEILIRNKNADSIRSISKSNETPYKMWFKNENNQILPIIADDNFKEPYNLPRQILPKTYIQNASVDVIRTATITELRSMTGSYILGYEMEDFIDIDYLVDFQNAQNQIDINVINKKFCFDIDGVVAQLSPNNDYNLAQPNWEMIAKINELYEKDNHIILFTARGSETGIDWYEITKNQLLEWNVKFHEFYTGKPNADFYIDDKNLLISQILKK